MRSINITIEAWWVKSGAFRNRKFPDQYVLSDRHGYEFARITKIDCGQRKIWPWCGIVLGNRVSKFKNEDAARSWCEKKLGVKP